ncbi:MAG TPA: PHB depolymerase family esterase [Streptosporangiaceae bacterium]|nr:PHB depolymerase family esterase [Streptosporangiaceae bacterium]
MLRACAWSTLAVIIFSLAACALAGCGPARPAGGGLPVGRSEHSMSVGGLDRSFGVYRPAGLTGAVPLVVMLHGGFGTGAQAEKSYGWDAQADAAHFVVAYPNGLDRAWDAGGGCCGAPGRQRVDDVAFIAAVVSAIERAVPIDRHRIYATGISNGGIMDYALACRTRIFAAIGPDSATELGRCPHPARVSVIHIHGTADKNIPYRGGLGDGPGQIDGPAVPAVNARWRRIDRCGAPLTRTAGVVTTSVAHCPGGRAVELITIAGAGHQWPGGRPNWLAEHLLHTDSPSKALNATKVIWHFFAAHPAGD